MSDVPIHVVAKVAPELATGVGDPRRPEARLRIQHDPCRFHAGCRHHHGASVNFHLLPRVSVYIGGAPGPPLLVHEDASHDRVRSKLEIPGLFGQGQQEPGSGEERSSIATVGAVAAEVARRVVVVGPGELRDPVRQVGSAHLLGASLQDVVEAPQLHRRQVFSVWIAGTVLHRARHADHLFDAAVIRGYLLVRHRPIHIVAIKGRGAEIDVAETR